MNNIDDIFEMIWYNKADRDRLKQMLLTICEIKELEAAQRGRVEAWDMVKKLMGFSNSEEETKNE